MRKISGWMLWATLAVGAPVAAATPPADVANNPAAPMLGGTDTGPSQQCIQRSLIRKTRIVNDQVIMFQVGNRWYRSDLPQACKGLDPTRALVDRSQGGNLCAGDAFDIVAPGQGQGLGQNHGVCLYGRFTPYMPPQAK